MSSVFSGTKPKSFYVLLALLGIATVAAVVWLFYPRYVPLAAQNAADQANLIQRLEAQGVDYKVDDTGTLLVDEAATGKGLVAQAAERQGNFAPRGLELYDQADYSMTEHTQQVTLMRALQGELERTIGALDFVRYARVHLTFGEKKMFDKQPVPAKAAVTLFPEVELNRLQVEGVQALVAAAVPGLKTDAVTVLDEEGRVLSKAIESGGNTNAVRIQQQHEQEYRQKIEQLLGLMYTAADYSVATSVELNNTEKHSVKQQLLTDAAGNGVVTQHQQSATKNKSLEGASSPLDTSENSDIRYAHGTATEEVTEPAGTITRLAVSVLIRADATAEKQQQVQRAIEVAIGANTQRGDQVSVQFIGAPTTINKQVPQSAAPTVATTPLQADVSSQWFVIFAVLLVLILGIITVVLRRRNRLTQEQRHAVLQEIQQWLNASEATRG